MRKQSGVSLMGLIISLSVLGFLGVMAAKLMPAYVEYWSIKKMIQAMVDAGDMKGTVREIRASFDKRNAIEDVKSVRAADLEVTKEGGEAVVTASWSARIPMVGNASACLDFVVTSAK